MNDKYLNKYNVKEWIEYVYGEFNIKDLHPSVLFRAKRCNIDMSLESGAYLAWVLTVYDSDYDIDNFFFSTRMEAWVNYIKEKKEKDFIDKMDFIRNELDNKISFLREKYKISKKYPLNNMFIVCPYHFEKKDEWVELIKEVAYCKQVVFIGDDVHPYVDITVYVKTPLVGKRLGNNLKQIIEDVKNKKYTLVDDKCIVSGFELSADEFELRMTIKENVTGITSSDNKSLFIIDTVLTDELKDEGLVNIITRNIQECRKSVGLHLADRIDFKWESTDEQLIRILHNFKKDISTTILAINYDRSEIPLKYTIEDLNITYDFNLTSGEKNET